MEKESKHTGAGDDDVVVDAALGLSSSAAAAKKPELDEKARRAPSLEQPATPVAAAAAATKKQPSSDDDDSKPRFWTRYPSSKLNEPVEGEGLDLEAERKVHEAHERHEKVCLGSSAAVDATSPGSGVAAAMARLGRESLSMSD